MPKFETPPPIAVTVDVFVGNVEIIASDRADAVVEVRPSDPDKKADVRGARETEVDFAAGNLTVKGPGDGRCTQRCAPSTPRRST